jgi:hypothetical protein
VASVLDQPSDVTRELLDRLRHPDFQRVSAALSTRGVPESDAATLLRGVREAPESVATICTLKSEVEQAGCAVAGALVERFLLVRAACDLLPSINRLRVGPGVEKAIRAEFRFYAHPPEESWRTFEAGTATFVAMSKIATGRRFPAGQFDWEVSGISRSDLVAVSWPSMPATLAFAALKMRALRPVFFSHLGVRRRNRSLVEDDANRSYYQMAHAMRLQPEIVGFAACSWFRSPETHRVSPHLAWLSRVFVENGGYVVEAGLADPNCGVLARSRTRRELFDQGKFRPTRGLVMWPRAAMLAWADAHPELGEEPPAD